MTSTVLMIVLTMAYATVRADNLVYDAYSKLAVRKPLDDIVIVAIDNRSVAALGRWPWPRTLHADLLRRLAGMRPKAIAYDTLFLEPDRDPATDAALAEGVKAAWPTFLALNFDVPGANGAPFDVAPPVAPLHQAAAGIGQVNVEFDRDGVVRRAFLAEGDGVREWPHLMALMRRAAREPPPPVRDGGEARPVGGAGLLRSDPVLIGFAGPAGSFRTISFVDILRGETPPEFLRGKLVLVGATADGLGDRYPTPLSDGAQAMPGVELQANLLDTMLSGRAIHPLPMGWAVVMSLAPLWLMLAGFLRLPPRANMLLGGGLIVATLAASGLLLLAFRIWAPPATALLGLLLVYPLWSWRRLEASSAYMVEELAKFADEPDVLSALSDASHGGSGDLIDRQVDLMRRAIRRARDLRGFVTDALLGLPDPILVAGLDDRVIIANHEAQALFSGVSGHPPEGERLSDLTARFVLSAPEDASADHADREMTAPDGRVFNVRRIALQNASRQAAGWIVRLTDITTLKAAGQQREQILQLLTHDMRSPQVSILTLMEGADPRKLPEGLAGRIAAYARRTLALADDFVQLARAEQPRYETEIVNLGDLLTEAADDQWPQSDARRIAVTVEGADEDYPIRADRGLLTRALINLIGNAVKYTEPGGRVTCGLAREMSPKGPEAVCVIADTGRGMSSDQLAHLFQRFRRAAPGGQDKTDGVGLGLAFVQAVVVRHGGTIDCQSRLGEGTTFTLRLPLDEAQGA